ncbi:MAG: hypothetical protein EPN82_11545 [Bacteroidetes bacterium]|nr:MAG: hypothetical protein EPN82_11545 [Bacteroidota bacterium]
MANIFTRNVITSLEEKHGKLKRLGDGYSLYLIPSIDTIVYFRYSKISKVSKNVLRTFYGLRNEDIKLMQSKKSFICLVTDDETKNLFIPYQQFETYFLETSPSNDGQYKTQTLFKPTGSEIYFAGIGKFNAENYFSLEDILNITKTKISIPELSHTQIQSIIGSIGIKKGYNIWYPESDKQKIDSAIVDYTKVIEKLPTFSKEVDHIISEIDVIWLDKSKPISFYEVEHSTPIYSGLLRFNDVLLTISGSDNFNIVANNERESKFGKEINRPTFKQNKLIDKVTFLDYTNVYNWYHNLTGKYYGI